MQVFFGLRLDARQGPLLNGGLASPVLGRLGFLGLLETHLGLSRPSVFKPQRVAALLGCLRKLDDGHRFYSRSIKIDEVGAASELLQWRDEWLLAGWNGQATVDAPKRIRDMADVEMLARATVSPGEAERLLAVRDVLAKRRVPIDSVELLDALERLPKVWQDTLALLPINPHRSLSDGPQAPGLLGKVQEAALASLSTGTVQVVSVPDGPVNIEVYQSPSKMVAEHWLGARCRAQPCDRLILCEQGGASLDDTLRVTGSSACGFDEPSELRPALQTLGLALEMLWQPIDVHRLLEFLTHPYGPFNRSARQHLASAFAESPGMASQAWSAAKAKIGGLERGKELLMEVGFWLEGERWSRIDGAPLTSITARVERVARAMQLRLADAAGNSPVDAAAAAAGVMQCSAASQGLQELQRQGVERLTPRHLEQLLAEATASGSSNALATAQVGTCRSAVTCAVTSLESAAEVIWWMPSTPRLPEALPWSPAEVAALDAAGARLREPAQEMRALAREWLRPLLAANERFILVLPPQGEEEHPVWQLIRSIVPKLPVDHIDDALAPSGTLSEQVHDTPLPLLTRQLHTVEAVTSRREEQSYTSLSSLFAHPAIAVLKDSADIRPGAALTVEADNRLLGTLAHRLFELYFQQKGALHWQTSQIREWFTPTVTRLVEGEGAPLLMQGAGVALHRFKHSVLEALLALVAQLRAAGALSVKTEVELRGKLGAVPIVGKVDLLVELPDYRCAAIDAKWSSSSYFSKLLYRGGHLQLALYSSLIAQNSGKPPLTLGYFIIDSRTLLVSNAGIFPQARVCLPDAGFTVDSLLDMAKSTWAWRRSQLDQGILDVVDDRLGPLEEFQGPPGTLEVTGAGKWDADYQSLLGWRLDESH